MVEPDSGAKKKRKVIAKLNVGDGNSKPSEDGNLNIPNSGSTKKNNDMQSSYGGSSVCSIPLSQSKIAIDDIHKKMSQMAPVVSDDTIQLKTRFVQQETDPQSTVSDASMASQSAELSQKMAGISLDSNPTAGISSGSAMSIDFKIAQTTEDDPSQPYIKGNKQLSVEVKLSDIFVVDSLGAGAQGFVQKAVHKPTKKIIAMKVIQKQSDIKINQQILQELTTLHNCDCDYIVRSYGSFIKDGMVNIALEYMDAGSLAGVIKEVKKIPENIIGLITVQILKGLEYLHKTMKVIHRDIKPSNILINKKGQVKIADFGVSGQIEGTYDCKSTWVGTAKYMSPERFSGESYFSDTDIWSLGLMLCECANGRFPYPPEESQQADEELTFWELMNFIQKSEPPSLPPGSTPDFVDFVHICLRKQGGTRSSAAELLQHPFAKKYEKTDIKYLKRWIKTIC